MATDGPGRRRSRSGSPGAPASPSCAAGSPDRRMTGRVSLLFAFLVSQPLDAQAPGPLDAAAETITASDLRAKIEILADDSMMGRDTPSPGLERAAAYVRGEFRRLGLRPAGELGTYVQRFGVSRWTVDTAASSLELAARGARTRALFGREVRVIG